MNTIISPSQDNGEQALPEFVCERCGYTTHCKSNLLRHLKRVKTCKPTQKNIDVTEYITQLTARHYNEKTYDCEYCNKRFNNSGNKSRHKKICKAANTQTQQTQETQQTPQTTDKAENDNNEASTSYQLTKSNLKKEDIAESVLSFMHLIAARLEKVENAVVTNKPLTTNTNIKIINNNTNNINIQLNNFGKENTSYLSNEFLSYCLLNPKKGMTSLIENIHYNSEYPENQNIRCKSLKNNVFEKYIDSEWRTCDAFNTLDELIRKGYKILNAHYTEHFMNDPEIYEDVHKQRAFERFRFLSDSKCNDYFAVKRELRLLVKDKTLYLLESPKT